METQALPHTRDPEFATPTARGTSISRGAEKTQTGKGRKEELLMKVQEMLQLL